MRFSDLAEVRVGGYRSLTPSVSRFNAPTPRSDSRSSRAISFFMAKFRQSNFGFFSDSDIRHSDFPSHRLPTPSRHQSNVVVGRLAGPASAVSLAGRPAGETPALLSGEIHSTLPFQTGLAILGSCRTPVSNAACA